MIKGVCVFYSILAALSGFSQQLEGEWNGDYTTDATVFLQSTKIKLIFVKLNDTVYQAYSKTYISKTDSIACVMHGYFTGKNTLYLEETRAIQYTPVSTQDNCMQQMELKYAEGKKRISLTGNWHTKNNSCGTGTIQLYKKHN